MIIIDAYIAEHISERSKSRFDITAGTYTNEAFEQPITNKEGEQFFYLCNDTHSKGKSKADYAITHGSYHMTGVYVSVGERFGYGNIKGTSDALIFDLKDCSFIDGHITANSKVIIYIARGCARDANEICRRANWGEYDGEFKTILSKLKSSPKKK